MQNIQPIKICVSCSRHKFVWNLAYLGVIMMSIVKKHKIVSNVAYLR